MNVTVVRYRVKPDRAAENELLVQAVYEELGANAPHGFRYATFVAEDGVSFLHVALVEEGSSNPLPAVAAFARFQKDVAERCEEGPVVTSMRVVGSFRAFTS